MSKIRARDLTVTFSDRNNIFTALDHVSFNIEEGEFVCLVGHSGCGKSTLLRVLSGLQEKTSGSVTIDGEEIIGPGSDRTVVFQQYSLFPWMTARKNIIFGLEQARPKESRETLGRIADQYLARVGMTEAANKYPFQLSGGMRQRVAIARALAIDSEIILLDEPFGALDEKARTSLQQLLTELWEKGEKKKTILFVTHDIDEAILLSDRILFMSPGHIEATIPVDLPRPRSKTSLTGEQCFCGLRRDLVNLFYETDRDEDEEARDEVD